MTIAPNESSPMNHVPASGRGAHTVKAISFPTGAEITIGEIIDRECLAAAKNGAVGRPGKYSSDRVGVAEKFEVGN
jgi:hypothetical protein